MKIVQNGFVLFLNTLVQSLFASPIPSKAQYLSKATSQILWLCSWIISSYTKKAKALAKLEQFWKNGIIPTVDEKHSENWKYYVRVLLGCTVRAVRVVSVVYSVAVLYVVYYLYRHICYKMSYTFGGLLDMNFVTVRRATIAQKCNVYTAINILIGMYPVQRYFAK